MLCTQLQRKSLLIISSVFLAAVPGVAAPLFVSNYSFETLPAAGLTLGGCGTGCSYSQDAIPGWTMVGAGGQFQPGNPGNTNYFNGWPRRFRALGRLADSFRHAAAPVRAP